MRGVCLLYVAFAGATYQRAMNTIFHELIGGFLECYIDDIIESSDFHFIPFFLSATDPIRVTLEYPDQICGWLTYIRTFTME